jgi:transmembrane sensor
MTKAEYILLYEKCNSGNCTQSEKDLLEQYSDDFIFANGEWNTSELGDKRALEMKMYQRLSNEIKATSVPKFKLWPKLSIVAALFLVTSIGIVFFARLTKDHQDKDLTNLVIGPGKKKALLTLDDGSTIVLDESRNGVVANQGKTIITKNPNGQIVYQVQNSVSSGDSRQKYNTITTPKGAETQVILPDGTKVWLNAESSIKFPAFFSSIERKVELTGEGYLEVFENKKSPFKVLVKGVEVQVLGTHFNISAYGSNDQVTTTLLQGSVKLASKGIEAVLKPGQSGENNHKGKFTVQNVDVEDAVAWKNGYFIFHSESIESIMTKAARWYDVEVVYQPEVKDIQFEGKMARYESINELLKNLELTGEIRFKVQGRRVTVMAK